MTTNQDAYNQGYAQGKNQPDFARAAVNGVGVQGQIQFPVPFIQGCYDALVGRAPAVLAQGEAAGTPTGGGVLVLAPPPAPAGTPKPRVEGPIQTQQAPLYDPNNRPPLPVGPRGRFYEVVASLPLVGRVPFDVAVSVEKPTSTSTVLNFIKNLVNFQVLGSIPSDYSLGYQLSGPTGPLAAFVRGLIAKGIITPAQEDPRWWGLDAWYGAKTTEGVRLLGLAELQALGLK